MRFNEFKHYHYALAHSTTEALSDQVNRFITERRRLVDLFASQNKTIIKAIILDPEDEQSHDNLNSKIKEFFPHFFAFTITNEKGKPYYTDFDGNIGEVCLNDISSYLNNGSQHPRIHPNYNAYHFDILSQLNIDNKKNILLISFHANLLSDFINASQAPDHQTILATISEQILIEVFDAGPRVVIPRDDYRLNQDEKNRILSQTEIKNTLWHAVDLQSANLFDNQYNDIIIQMSWIILIIIALVSISLYLLIKEEHDRIKLKQQKDEYLSILNHELRSPITGIQGSLELISHGRLGKLSEELAKFINIALENTKNLLVMINEMIDYDKLSTGSMEINLREENLLEIVEDTITSLKGYTIKFNVQLKVKANREVNYLIKLDKKIIIKVLQNIITNASKYGKDNDIIEITLTKNENYISIEITDHGQGIPEKYHKTLFDKYTIVDNSSKKSATSTGLGLNIVKSLVKLHHGVVYFKSTIGEGTSFTVELPLV